MSTQKKRINIWGRGHQSTIAVLSLLLDVQFSLHAPSSQAKSHNGKLSARSAYINRMASKRIAKLIEIGFNFERNGTCLDKPIQKPNANSIKWMARYEELKEYRHEVGHCYSPHKCKSYPLLGGWVCRQRVLFKCRAFGRESCDAGGDWNYQVTIVAGWCL